MVTLYLYTLHHVTRHTSQRCHAVTRSRYPVSRGCYLHPDLRSRAARPRPDSCRQLNKALQVWTRRPLSPGAQTQGGKVAGGRRRPGDGSVSRGKLGSGMRNAFPQQFPHTQLEEVTGSSQTSLLSGGNPFHSITFLHNINLWTQIMYI